MSDKLVLSNLIILLAQAGQMQQKSEDNLNLLIKHFSSDLININSDKLQSQQKKIHFRKECNLQKHLDFLRFSLLAHPVVIINLNFQISVAKKKSFPFWADQIATFSFYLCMNIKRVKWKSLVLTRPHYYRCEISLIQFICRNV